MKTRVQALTAALALCCIGVFGETTAKPSIALVQAELMKDAQAHRLKVGATVFARTTADWQGPDCALRSGAILEAQVVSVVPHTKAAKGSELSLAFTRAQCGEKKMSDFKMLLFAIAAPPVGNLEAMTTAPMEIRALGQGGVTSIADAPLGRSITLGVGTPVYQSPVIPRMKKGDVIGIRGLKLSVGTGPDASSVLTSKDHDVSLVEGSVFLLIPAEGTFLNAPANPEHARAPSDPPNAGGDTASGGEAAVSAEPPAEDIDLCVPPQCNVSLPSGNADDMGKATASISIRQLGYAPRPQRMMYVFDHDEALAYLGPRELLVAFNPHKLLTRHMLGGAGQTVRVIHVVLVNTVTRQIEHSADWELPDNGQYLWPLADGRVLAHVGSELRVYGDGLKIQNRVSVDGPLAFVRVTPDGNFVAIGVIRERHTPELHAQLRESLGLDPEEDVEIAVLNRNFESIARSTSRSRLMPPTLLNEGQAELLAGPNMRYSLSMVPWDNHGRTVARFSSSCLPQLSSIAPDLMFLVSCDKQTRQLEYRVLRPNGKLEMEGLPGDYECGHAAEGSANREDFVVKVVKASQPLLGAGELAFSEEDLSSEELSVYRATDTKRLLRVRVASPSSSREGFAVSPDGSQLAVMTRDQIALYSVPRE